MLNNYLLSVAELGLKTDLGLTLSLPFQVLCDVGPGVCFL